MSKNPATEDGGQETDNPEPRSPPFTISNPNEHTMLGSLFDYVHQKMHQDIMSQEWFEIIVRGEYKRTVPARVANCEKKGKMFNWHRPTTTILSPTTIAVNCFPGIDYTEHYASLIATYLALAGKDPRVVKCVRPPASRCREIFLKSNLADMGHVDVIVIGYVYQLHAVSLGKWETGGSVGGGSGGFGGGGDRVVFSWQKQHLPNSGRTVAYLACLPSFWGDISYHLVHALQYFNRPKCLVYLGKAGSLRHDIAPNEWLVTGGESRINDVITWDNVLAPGYLTDLVSSGTMVTVPSPLCESLDWLAQNKDKSSWVDCEVGHMARECRETETQFGYLHIISDNISGVHEENLANEQAGVVRTKRRRLFDEVETILQSFLRGYGVES